MKMPCRRYAAEAITVITTGAVSIAASPAIGVTGGVSSSSLLCRRERGNRIWLKC